MSTILDLRIVLDADSRVHLIEGGDPVPLRDGASVADALRTTADALRTFADRLDASGMEQRAAIAALERDAIVRLGGGTA